MSTGSLVPHTARHIRHEAATHRFVVGQAVRMRGRFGNVPKDAEIYRVTRMLPPSGDSPQYRIRSDDERYERVTTEDGLEPAEVLPSDKSAALIQKTFSGG
ncbi:hypothetical protein SAZ10_33375 [Mesorhizobium sp. BAC0120]|uniref:hypothetical protein n=1 Tax=Mesorhizobium sp. BAC0120 TaxID=3090670 RepID=UPI00298C01EC|nr:hypothetical protein [Mesorhizobium sp. BAC0120]MDW6026661.1 hypothetical protein [Mesorhizobium sp. BAC0120]